MQTIEVRGVEYKLVKARDFEVIVRSDKWLHKLYQTMPTN